MVASWLEWGATSPKKDDTKERQDLCCHDWDATEHWGIIIGISCCLKCMKLSMPEDFPWLLQIK